MPWNTDSALAFATAGTFVTAVDGEFERSLAERYEGFAATIRATHPRTARLLRELAKSYRRDASRHASESERAEERW